MGGDHQTIRRGIERLDSATRRLAELMMDNAVGGAMKGKTMAAAGEAMGTGPTAPHPFAKAQFTGEPPKIDVSFIESAKMDEETPSESTED